MDSKDINERRRGDLDKFLTTTNTKAAVFRDIIIESGVTAVDSGLGLRFCRVVPSSYPPHKLAEKQVPSSARAVFGLLYTTLSLPV